MFRTLAPLLFALFAFAVMALAIHLSTILLGFRKSSFLRAAAVALIFAFASLILLIPLFGPLIFALVGILSIRAIYEEGWLKSIAAFILGFIVLLILLLLLSVLGVALRLISRFPFPWPS